MPTVVTLTNNRFPQITRNLRQESRKIVQETVFEIETGIKVDMAQSKSGRIYPRPSGEHQASAPGESPAVDSSALINSIQTTPVGNDGTAEVYTNMEYAIPLEYGADGIAPRPFMTPAAEAARPNFMRKMSNLESRL